MILATSQKKKTWSYRVENASSWCHDSLRISAKPILAKGRWSSQVKPAGGSIGPTDRQSGFRQDSDAATSSVPKCPKS